MSLTPDQRTAVIEEQIALLKELEHRQSLPGYEVGTDARHELDMEILEVFHLVESLR